MSRELTINFAANYEDDQNVVGEIEVPSLQITLATNKLLHTTQTVGTTQEAMIIGDIVSLGFCILVNLDPTNYIEVKVATSGAIFAKLFPKDSEAGLNFWAGHLGSGAQAPFVMANSASCEMEIFLCPL